VHRDLKPENLLFETDDERSMIKVIDFGTSQVYADKKKMHKTYGTPYYIAPEILAGEYDEKCDVWSVGVIMFILLSGRPPFDGDSDEEILGLVSKGLYSLNDQCWNKISDEGIDLLK
jgi:calcium-dependent protein kinase